MTVFDGIFPQLATTLVAPGLGGVPATYAAPDSAADEPDADGASTRGAPTEESILCTPPVPMTVEEAAKAGVGGGTTSMPEPGVRMWRSIVPASSISAPPSKGAHLTVLGQVHRVVGVTVLASGLRVAAYELVLESTGGAP